MQAGSGEAGDGAGGEWGKDSQRARDCDEDTDDDPHRCPPVVMRRSLVDRPSADSTDRARPVATPLLGERSGQRLQQAVESRRDHGTMAIEFGQHDRCVGEPEPARDALAHERIVGQRMHLLVSEHLHAIPEPAQRGLVSNPIDAFLLARLETHGLSFSGEADRETLIRRIWFDLTGLPPTTDAIDRFAEDPSPEAWNTVVEELLNSTAYGEHWARHWLDAAGYADSEG